MKVHGSGRDMYKRNVCKFWGNQNFINPGIKTHPTFGWSFVFQQRFKIMHAAEQRDSPYVGEWLTGKRLLALKKALGSIISKISNLKTHKKSHSTPAAHFW